MCHNYEWQFDGRNSDVKIHLISFSWLALYFHLNMLNLLGQLHRTLHIEEDQLTCELQGYIRKMKYGRVSHTTLTKYTI